MKQQPPKIWIKFLRWFCREDFLDEIEGDLKEIYYASVSESRTKANRAFLLSILGHFRPEYIKLFQRTTPTSKIGTDMIRSYIILAFRNLAKRAAFSIINISGLALGVSACLMILQFIAFETSYDKFNVNAPNVYRVVRSLVRNNEPLQPSVVTTYGYGPALESDIPGVKRSVRTHGESAIVSYQLPSGDAKTFHEERILIADSDFFDVFTFKAISGELSTALSQANNIVITRSVSKKYFGDAEAVGKTLSMTGSRTDQSFLVSAVIEDVPSNSHFSFNMVQPMHNLLQSRQYRNDEGWGWNNFVTYIQLNDGVSPESLTSRLADFAKRRLDPRFKDQNISFTVSLQPLLDIHLHPGLKHDVETVSRGTISFFAIIALFILFIAWINYINLSTARAMERAREVGIKKTIGAFRSQLMMQFLFEAIVINFISITLAVIITVILLPQLAEVTGKNLSIDFSDVRTWIVPGVLFAAGSVASGLYPSVVLSSFRITQALQHQRENRFSLRKTLVTFQFAASMLLLAGTFVVYQQLHYMQQQHKGLQMDQMLIVAGPGSLNWKEAQVRLGTLRDQIRIIPGVDAVATSASVPGRGHNWGADVRKISTPATENKSASVVWVDTDFIPTYKINLIAGKNFDPGIRSDMKSVIVNEAAVTACELGTPWSAIGQKLIVGDDTTTVLGVASNYNWNSLKSEFTPFLLMPDTIQTADISVHLQGGSIPRAIDRIAKVYKELMPQEPFEYSFLDDTFNAQYRSDMQLGKLFGFFAGLAVMISCLGLWGLAAFTTAQRLKEIGIRKVLGASVASILVLLSSQFLKLVSLACIISLPLAWYGIHNWLAGFAFHIGVEWYLFMLPVAVLIATTLLTVSFQVIRGAHMNPARVLRSE